MIISGVTYSDLEAARDVASRALGNEIMFPEFSSYSPKRHRVRLMVRDIDGPGARRHSQMFWFGYGKRPRRSRYACAHRNLAIIDVTYGWSKTGGKRDANCM
jgi:hypothetical protein